MQYDGIRSSRTAGGRQYDRFARVKNELVSALDDRTADRQQYCFTAKCAIVLQDTLIFQTRHRAFQVASKIRLHVSRIDAVNSLEFGHEFATCCANPSRRSERASSWTFGGVNFSSVWSHAGFRQLVAVMRKIGVKLLFQSVSSREGPISLLRRTPADLSRYRN